MNQEKQITEADQISNSTRLEVLKLAKEISVSKSAQEIIDIFNILMQAFIPEESVISKLCRLGPDGIINE